MRIIFPSNEEFPDTYNISHFMLEEFQTDFERYCNRKGMTLEYLEFSNEELDKFECLLFDEFMSEQITVYKINPAGQDAMVFKSGMDMNYSFNGLLDECDENTVIEIVRSSMTRDDYYSLGEHPGW